MGGLREGFHASPLAWLEDCSGRADPLGDATAECIEDGVDLWLNVDETIACLRLAPPEGVDLSALEDRLQRDFPIVCSLCHRYVAPTAITRVDDQPQCIDQGDCSRQVARAQR